MVNRYLVLAVAAATVAACSSGPELRPRSQGWAGPVATPFEIAYADGKRHLAANRIGLALVAFQRAAGLDPASILALNGVGACFDLLHRPDAAMSVYQRALRLDPASADTVNNIGVSLMLAGRGDEARAALVAAARLSPGEQAIQANLAMAEVKPRTPIAAPASEVSPIAPAVELIGLRTYSLAIPASAPASRPAAGPIMAIARAPAEPLAAVPREPVQIEPLAGLPTPLVASERSSEAAARHRAAAGAAVRIDPGTEALFIAFERRLAAIRPRAKS
jgi:tetratricopeptide (TPR) repeat protein